MKVVVTGADGFIGSHVCESLIASGHDVRALSLYTSLGTNGWLDDIDRDIRKAIEIVPGDLRDAEFVKNLVVGSDVVINLAALIAIPYSYTAPRSFVETNILGTLNVLEGVRAHDVSLLVQLSTSEVYGSAVSVPMSEAHRLHAQSPYAATKIASDQLALSFFRSFRTPVTVVRPFNTFGPRQSLRAVIPTIINQSIAGASHLKLGSTTTIRDFTFVRDTAEALKLSCEVDRSTVVGREMNLGIGLGVSVAEVVEIVSKICGRELHVDTDSVRLRPEGSEVDRLVSDNRLARELLGWSPKFASVQGLHEAMEATYRWFEANQARYAHLGDQFVV